MKMRRHCFDIFRTCLKKMSQLTFNIKFRVSINKNDSKKNHLRVISLEKSYKFFLRMCIYVDRIYSLVHRFMQAKFANSGSIFSRDNSEKFKLASKVIKIDSKIIFSQPWSKSVKQTVQLQRRREAERCCLFSEPSKSKIMVLRKKDFMCKLLKSFSNFTRIKSRRGILICF
jgi:hypothetical protein